MPLFPEEIGTDRLNLEQLCHENLDVLEYYHHCSHHKDSIAEVTRYLPWDAHETVKETEEHIDSLEEQWKARPRAEYVIRPKEREDGRRDCWVGRTHR